jgi:hypothetical protein
MILAMTFQHAFLMALGVLGVIGGYQILRPNKRHLIAVDCSTDHAKRVPWLMGASSMRTAMRMMGHKCDIVGFDNDEIYDEEFVNSGKRGSADAGLERLEKYVKERGYKNAAVITDGFMACDSKNIEFIIQGTTVSNDA